MISVLTLAALLSSAPAPAEGRVKIPTLSGAVLAGAFDDAGTGGQGVLFFPMRREDAMDRMTAT
jgi:hypothetical protein